jgi:rod shape-determining protein MreC
MFRRNSPDFTGRLTLAGILAALALVVIIVDQGGLLRPVEQVTSTILNPLERASYQLGTNLNRFSDFLSDNEKLRAENAQLRAQLQAALGEQGKVADLANQVDALQKQLEFRKNPENKNFVVVNADVINRDGGGVNQGVIINKGSNDNLTVGMTVVDVSGYLVGRLLRVEAKQSYVLLISDNNIGVNVVMRRYGQDNKPIPIQPPVDGTALGMAQLRTEEKIRISHLKPDADIKVDDWVFTNGLGGTYPANLLVGKVGRVISEAGQPEKEAVVVPIADLDHLQQVLVITGRNDQ